MNNEINNINENEDKKTINTQNNNTKYKNIFHCPLLYNDIASAIDLDNNYLVYGTFMGEVALCLIDEISFNKTNDESDDNNTNANITIEEDNKNEKKIKEIKLITHNKYKTGNQNNYQNNKKIIKDVKIYLNKEPDSEEFKQTEDINSNKFYTDKIINNYNSSRIKKLYHNKIEQISCVSLLNNTLNFGVGDYQLIHCEKISSLSGKDIKNSYNFLQINNYLSEKVHEEFCETAQCFMTKSNYLIVYSFYSDFNWPLKFNQVKYENKNLINFDIIKGSIYMSNFNVPFDFDGNKFLYLEYYSKTMRCINIYNTLEDQKIFQFFIKNDFGHISFMKLLPDNCIFLCRQIYLCEIYKINCNININNSKNEQKEINIKDFVLLKSWTHVQDYEIISCNVYILEKKKNYEKEKEKKFKSSFNNSKIKKEKDNKNRFNYKNYAQPLKLLESENSSDSYSLSKNKFFHFDKNNNNNDSIDNNIDDLIKLEKVKNNNIKVNINNRAIDYTVEKNIKFYIITLDIEGNFNLYLYNQENNEEIKNTLFNLYEIQNIENNYKNLKFFSMGYPYYITMNDYFYVITTDNGIFVINSEKEDN